MGLWDPLNEWDGEVEFYGQFILIDEYVYVLRLFIIEFDILNTSMSYVTSQRLGIDLDRRGMTKGME